LFADNEIWICKPTGKNQGKGIFLVRTLDDINRAIAENDEANQQNKQEGKPQKPMNRIIQR
jgi:tubulin--tyrosine ligase like protein 10